MKQFLFLLTFLAVASLGLRAQGAAAPSDQPGWPETPAASSQPQHPDDALASPSFESVAENAIEESNRYAEEQHEEKPFDIKQTIFDHLGDGYGWEVPFNHHKRMPLPVIVWGQTGFHCFSSSRVAHDQVYNDNGTDFKIATSGPYKGKIVEVIDGQEYKPFDISITKNVLAIFIACIIVLVLALMLAHWHRHNPFKAPRKLRGMFEALVEFIYVGVIKPTLKDKAAKFAPYLLTVFFFIFFMNLLGLIVVFPGGANVTGNIAVTMVLAIMTFVITNVFSSKVYWKEIFWPDVPIWLKFPLPIMQVIEVFGLFTKPAALTVRLFANMMGGHMIVLILTMLIFIFAAMGYAVASGVAVISVAFSVFMLLIDCLVSFIQAYVFTMLSTLFISLAQDHEHHKEEEKDKAAAPAPAVKAATTSTAAAAAKQ